MSKIINCKVCGKEMAKSAKVCPSCGAKNKKPIYVKWWFWAVIVILIVAIGSSAGNNETTTVTENGTEQVNTITYEAVDLQTMFDDLAENAMKAESEYKKKCVEFECKIASFDSDGGYISVEPVGASEWNFTTAMCYIKNDSQKDFLIEKSVGDTVTIKGKVKSIGEVLGYSIDINEIY